MKVLNAQYNTNYLPQTHPSFRNWNHIVYRNDYQGARRFIDSDISMRPIKHQTKTEVFRYDDYLPNMLDYAVEKFKNREHVNFYSYGCSNCSETYSILMYLISKYGEDTARKFTPIFARDYDKVAISHAKSGVLPINQQEYERIQKYTEGNFEKFFLVDKPPDFSECKNIDMNVNPKYYSMIDIQQADIRDDYVNIPPQDTILTTINFLPYLPDNDNKKLVSNITNHLNKNSMWWFGPYEIQSSYHFIDRVCDSGFSTNNRPYGVYEKQSYTTYIIKDCKGIGEKIRGIIRKINNSF